MMVSEAEVAGGTAPRVIALFGPTGVGKTAVAVALAGVLRARGEDPVAVSADALQVYAGLEVLTGVATPAQQAELEHRLISFLAPHETFSAGRYAQLAHAEIDRLLATGRRPIVVGGTGLYLRAALTQLSLRPPPAAGVRERWTAVLDDHGPAALHAHLAARAPATAAAIAPTDGRRIVRALETIEPDGPAASRPDHGPALPPAATVPAGPRPDASGEPTSELWTAATRHPTLLVGLTMQRDALYRRIDVRVGEMVAAGAADEVRRSVADSDRHGGVSATARQALGFQELLAGDVDAMSLRTRRYARRQLTWMRKLAGVHVIDVTDRPPQAVAGEIVDALDDTAHDGPPR